MADTNIDAALVIEALKNQIADLSGRLALMTAHAEALAARLADTAAAADDD